MICHVCLRKKPNKEEATIPIGTHLFSLNFLTAHPLSPKYKTPLFPKPSLSSQFSLSLSKTSLSFSKSIVNKHSLRLSTMSAYQGKYAGINPKPVLFCFVLFYFMFG